jgi:hypothetical protein
MFDAKHRYWYAAIYKNKKHCFNCGRNWELDEFQLREFPERKNGKNGGNKFTESEAKAVASALGIKFRKKKKICYNPIKRSLTKRICKVLWSNRKEIL